ncbi:unnamed protein product [Ilex paraguariensis]|uniref:RNA polymerase Rpb4/RPC9 core domain-containing protein n=1 Tax=Ilex paraguariensis TaxID=185542 RepID=A0ABC8TPW9_9AQUA
MAEKGEKGFSLSNGGKSSLKSPASFKGKDDSTAKSKRGRKVQFDAEEAKISMSSKSGGKVDKPVARGLIFLLFFWRLGQRGKGDKIANGGEVPVVKAPPPLELKIEHAIEIWAELPENAKCLMDCEAAEILQGIQEQMVILSEDPAIKIPISFDRGLQYAKRGSHYISPHSVRRVLDALKLHNVSDGEVSMIANVGPESVEEVFALVPSLKGKKSKLREPLKDALDQLAKLKHST